MKNEYEYVQTTEVVHCTYNISIEHINKNHPVSVVLSYCYIRLWPTVDKELKNQRNNPQNHIFYYAIYIPYVSGMSYSLPQITCV